MLSPEQLALYPTAEDVRKELAHKRSLMRACVGTLYPDMLLDEIIQLEERLRALPVADEVVVPRELYYMTVEQHIRFVAGPGRWKRFLMKLGVIRDQKEQGGN